MILGERVGLISRPCRSWPQCLQLTKAYRLCCRHRGADAKREIRASNTVEHLCLDVWVKPGHDGTLSAIEERCHERVDPLRHAGLGQRRADKAPCALKFYVLGQ